MEYSLINQWIGITMTVARLNVIPADELEAAGDNEANRRWALTAKWYEAEISGNGYSFAIPYGMGVGNGDDIPTLDDVMSSLVSLSRDAEYAESFEDWADNWGYSHDSRKAEDMYLSHKALAGQLRRVCGGQEKYDRLLAKNVLV